MGIDEYNFELTNFIKFKVIGTPGAYVFKGLCYNSSNVTLKISDGLKNAIFAYVDDIDNPFVWENR